VNRRLFGWFGGAVYANAPVVISTAIGPISRFMVHPLERSTRLISLCLRDATIRPMTQTVSGAACTELTLTAELASRFSAQPKQTRLHQDDDRYSRIAEHTQIQHRDTFHST
jgi:hypothetical protein